MLAVLVEDVDVKELWGGGASGGGIQPGIVGLLVAAANIRGVASCLRLSHAITGSVAAGHSGQAQCQAAVVKAL